MTLAKTEPVGDRVQYDNEAPDRYVGEPGSYATDFEREHYMSGRIFGIGVRYKFDR